MVYLFTNITGCFLVDDTLKILDSILFHSVQDYLHKEQAEQRMRKKHSSIRPLPDKLQRPLLRLFKDPKYFSAFYDMNTAVTRDGIRHSVTPDQFVIQAISTIEETDRTCNLLAKRLREWYGLYCPEIVAKMSSHESFIRIILDNDRAALLKEFHLPDTMGADLPAVHLHPMRELAQQLVLLYAMRKKHEDYLVKVMYEYCPNILDLAGATIGAKLLELGKGLKHLALLPASTIQLLGAEKALFRHLTSGARSPKHGIIVNHPLVAQAKKDQKGKAARMLADKISLCARLDYFKGEFKAKEYRKELEEKLR